jgi:hypothetical protein
LSAGGAMAAILATTYPELFGAVGVHSGLAPGKAHDLPSALKAMQGHGLDRQTGAPDRPIPLILFHAQRRGVHPPVGWRTGPAARNAAPGAGAGRQGLLLRGLQGARRPDCGGALDHPWRQPRLVWGQSEWLLHRSCRPECFAGAGAVFPRTLGIGRNDIDVIGLFIEAE